MITCMHGRPAADPLAVVDPAHEPCLDCAELMALRDLELGVREFAPRTWMSAKLAEISDIRRRKGIGALGHPETRDLEGR